MSEDSFNRGQKATEYSNSQLVTKNQDMVTPLQKKVEKAQKSENSNNWLIAGVAAGFCYGFGNLCVVKTSHFGFYTRELVLFGWLIQALTFWVGRFFYVKHSTGKFWNWKNSPFRDPETDKFRWSPVWAVILDTIIKVT